MESDKYHSRLMAKVRLAMYSKPFVCVAARSCRRIDLATVTLMLLTVGGMSCSRPATQREYPVQRDFPNVLLISMDTTRRDHCSVYGYQRPTTPVLDELGEQGAVFDLAYAPHCHHGILARNDADGLLSDLPPFDQERFDA